MKHSTYEKWISDLIDNALSDRKKFRLKKHLDQCPVCRAYQGRLETLSKKITEMKKAEEVPAYLKNFSSRLHNSLLSLDREKAAGAVGVRKLKWAYALVPVVIAVLVIGYLALSNRLSPVQQERFVFSFEETMQQINYEIGEDKELKVIFNRMILTFIHSSLEDFQGEESSWFESPFVDGVTGEEFKYLSDEIKKMEKS
ncbi:MAG: zf-HC2 domain-containing protein [Candidatus Aminicenantes bacterium]|nr:zf-HC2 domain-containing protein [Candidatus Aminicenantes bacterium]